MNYQLRIKIKWPELSNYYYPIIIALYFYRVYRPGIRIGIAASLVMLLIFGASFVQGKFQIKDKIDVIVALFILYNLCSGFLFLINGLPMDIFIREFSNTILPMGFYFLAKTNAKPSRFLKFTSYAILFFIVTSLYFHIKVPQSYINYFRVAERIYAVRVIKEVLRSYIGITAMGSLSAVGFLLCFCYMFQKRNIMWGIASAVCFYALFLNSRRSAMVSVFFMLFIVHYYFIKWKVITKKMLLYELLTVCLGAAVFVAWKPSILSTIGEKIVSLSTAVSSRSGQWVEGLQSIKNFFLGSGLGSVGHKSIGFSDVGVYDGSYVKLLCENGIVGFLLFLIAIILCISYGFKNKKIKYMDLGIIGIFLLQAIGSNIFGFQILMPLFWFCLGNSSKSERNIGTERKLEKVAYSRQINLQQL